jgi:hypothetical protein
VRQIDEALTQILQRNGTNELGHQDVNVSANLKARVKPWYQSSNICMVDERCHYAGV